MTSQFIILIGGPGTYESCDAKHDKIWLNYLYPMQVAAEKDLYSRGTEQVHWVVYEPAYHVRWLDDSEITMWEGAREAVYGNALHKVRKAAADNVKSKGASSYVDRIRKLAHAHAITYKGISTPKEFWDYLASFPPKSISRVWYSGHAAGGGLILALTHNAECVASWSDASTVLTAEIAAQTKLKDRFLSDPARPSRFYGCATEAFAKAWHESFGVPTEGARKSITFANILNDDPKKLLRGLQETPTAQGAPGWTSF